MVPVWIWQSLSLKCIFLHCIPFHFIESIATWKYYIDQQSLLIALDYNDFFEVHLAIIYNILKVLRQSGALLDRAETLLVHSWFHHHWILNHKLGFQTTLEDRLRFSISNSKWSWVGGGGHFTLMTLSSREENKLGTNLRLVSRQTEGVWETLGTSLL